MTSDTMTKKSKSAREVTVKLGDWFEILPDDLPRAAKVVADQAKEADGMDAQEARAFVKNFYLGVWAALLNEAIHSPAGGPRGPRLPAGVKLIDLLPHLSEARRAMAAKDTRFEGWLMAHKRKWPGRMDPGNTVVRKWLTRYASLIDAYDALPDK